MKTKENWEFPNPIVLNLVVRKVYAFSHSFERPRLGTAEKTRQKRNKKRKKKSGRAALSGLVWATWQLLKIPVGVLVDGGTVKLQVFDLKIEISDWKNLVKFGGKTFLPDQESTRHFVAIFGTNFGEIFETCLSAKFGAYVPVSHSEEPILGIDRLKVYLALVVVVVVVVISSCGSAPYYNCSHLLSRRTLEPRWQFHCHLEVIALSMMKLKQTYIRGLMDENGGKILGNDLH